MRGLELQAGTAPGKLHFPEKTSVRRGICGHSETTHEETTKCYPQEILNLTNIISYMY